jgi:hypothetical protein
MSTTKRYEPTDLVAVVWLTDSAAAVREGRYTWEHAANGSWAMSANKAGRVRVLIAIDDFDEVVGAWPVEGVDNNSAIPAGKGRQVNRATFELGRDEHLSYLLGSSPWQRRSNPQTTFELHKLPGADQLLAGRVPESGSARIGDFTLTVNDRGEAVLRIRPGMSLTIITTAV